MKNDIIICKDCGKEVEFPATITVNSLVNQRIEEEDAKKLLEARDSAKTRLAAMTNEEEKKAAKDKFLELEKLIINLSDGLSKEAYDFYGFPNLPARCKECRKKLKETRAQRAADSRHIRR